MQWGVITTIAQIARELVYLMIEPVAVVADPLINGIDSILHDVGDHQSHPTGEWITQKLPRWR